MLHEVLGKTLDDPLVNKPLKSPSRPQATRGTPNKSLSTAGRRSSATRARRPFRSPQRHAANIYDLAVNTVPPEKLPQFTAEVWPIWPRSYCWPRTNESTVY